MTTPGFEFRIAEEADADQLGTIGPAAFAETYGGFWNNADSYADHLATFGRAATVAFLARSDTRMWVVEQRRRIVGLLSLVLGSPDPVEGHTDGAEIPHIYLLAPARGKGLAIKLIALADRFARERGASHLWLEVMRAAPWAWQTYRRWGFEEIGDITFPGDIKPHLKPMVVMRRWCGAANGAIAGR